jgi:pyruvate/2-oxoglutarate/acetoin dehydrogenase E1 component
MHDLPASQMRFVEAIRDGLDVAMQIDPHLICYGLGIDDPKRIFGSTTGLAEKYGNERVFDVPTSEAAMTGIAVGAALKGVRSVTCHQRLDFFFLAMDQLINNAAKWHFMFGGQRSVPIVIRLILGRGWGQGPTHSQSVHSWFAHIPGLKVVMPTNASDAKGLLLSAIFDPNPVLFLEHRWLHEAVSTVPPGDYRVPLGQARVVIEGGDITVVAMSFLVPEAIRASSLLARHGVACHIIDLRTIRPLDWDTLSAGILRTGRLLALDSGLPICSVASEVVAFASERHFQSLKCAPRRLTMPDHPEPTSFALTRDLHPSAESIANTVSEMLGLPHRFAPEGKAGPHDVPGPWFKGPF